MTDLYQFMGEHPWLTFFLAVIALQLALAPFRLVRRYIRHRDIKAHGWPPAHIDADGDAIDGEDD